MGVRIETTPFPAFPAGSTYEQKHRILSSEERRVHVSWHGQHLFETMCPRGVFNPGIGVAADALIKVVLEHQLPVRDADVVDLGCGSGIIGLSCIHAGARSVLFSDVNPAVDVLARHRMLRDADRVCVQDLLTDASSESADVVIMSTPTALQLDGQGHAHEETNIGADDAFLPRVGRHAGRVLRPGGTLCLWVSLLLGPTWMESFVDAVVPWFDPQTFHVLDPAPEQAGQQNWMICRIDKRGGVGD